MIAAVRRRVLVARVRVESWTKAADRRANRVLVAAWPRIVRRAAGVRRRALRATRWMGRRLRPLGVLLFRFLSRLERRLLRGRDLAIRAATRASAVLTPQRSIGAAILASAACLVVAQFVEYRSVEIGQPGYAGLPAATAPTVDEQPAGQAHAYLLIPLALFAAGLTVAALRSGRHQLGRVVAALGLLGLAVVLLVDMPAGLDAGAQASRFSGATATLEGGFYGELAACGGLILGGLLLARRPRARRARVRRSRASKRGGRRRRRIRLARGRRRGRAAVERDGLQRPA
jgi:hypothetical protein